MRTIRALLALTAGFIAALATAADPPKLVHSATPPADPDALAAELEKAYAGKTPPESVRMLLAIVNGSQMGPGDGWFGPAQTRYTYEWLAKALGKPGAKGLSKTDFRGPADLFARLDRNKDGTIRPEDLDWSEDNPYVQMAYSINRIFRRLDASGSGKLTKEQWLEFYEKASGGTGTLTAASLSDALLAGYSGSFTPGDAPNKTVLVKGLFAGEIGSFHEGPAVGEKAPNFTLKKVEGGGTVELAGLIGEKPVVLVTGNFTCGPFRSFYPAVEEVYQRHKDKANFVMVYVREAHPTDGWKMESNNRAGVAVKQPTTFDERVSVAGQFCTNLKTTMPVVVDDVDDTVGHAYSGMPARLYVIDRAGKVAYKSGRGPFGFRPGEMEQALAMCLVEEALPKGKPEAASP